MLTEISAINTMVFECQSTTQHGTFEFTVRRGPGELALWPPWTFGRPYLVLGQVSWEEATTRYREGDVDLLLDEGGAELIVGNEHFSDCTEDRVRSVWEHAKLTGVDFRAVSTIPDWMLEIRRGGNLVFRSVWRDTELAAPTPEPVTDPQRGSTIYAVQLDATTLEVHVVTVPCRTPDRDDMTGSTVTVILDGRTFAGCGRALH